MSEHTIYKSAEGKHEILNYYESYLNLFEVPFERVRVDTRFGSTHVLVTGPAHAKPLMVLQGGNCINPMTLSWFATLFKDYRIYAPDTIGHPGFSAETRVSAKDDSYPLWISDLMDYFQLASTAFIGPSYGGGIILRLAAFLPEKISCAVLVSPAGLVLGSKWSMIQKILLPMLVHRMNGSQKQMQKIADVMSMNSMSEIDKQIIGSIFKNVRLEQDMPKLTERHELERYTSPTLVIAGNNDIFFPADKVLRAAQTVIPNVQTISYEAGHFPAREQALQICSDIQSFLRSHD